MKTVAIDPGHGGADPGGQSLGLPEKEINLRYSLALLQSLAIAGFRVVPTRVFDRYVAISERAALSNQVDADLFLSVHANASADPSARGLWTLHAAVSSRGKAIATAVQRELVSVLGGKSSAVYPDASGWTGNRRLGVLRQTRAPAVLVELGFMTNKGDIERIEDPLVMAEAVDAITRAVLGAL